MSDPKSSPDAASTEPLSAEPAHAAPASPEPATAAARELLDMAELPPADVTTISLKPRQTPSEPALPADIAAQSPLQPAMTLHDATSAAAAPAIETTIISATVAANPAARIAEAPPATPSKFSFKFSPKAVLAAVAAQARSITPAITPRHGAYAGGVAAALAAGWFGAALLTAPPAAKPDAVAIRTAQISAQVERLSADIKALRDSVATLGKSRARGGDDLKPLQERIANLTESVDKARTDHGAKITTLAGGVDRVEKLDRDLANRMTQIAERLDRIERQNAPQITGSITPPATTPPAAPMTQIPTPPPRPEQVAAVDKPVAAPVERKAIEGWTLRDMYDGIALIESRRAGMLEVAPGQVVRGLGRIEKFEKRGKQWVVVTDQGFIAAN